MILHAAPEVLRRVAAVPGGVGGDPAADDHRLRRGLSEADDLGVEADRDADVVGAGLEEHQLIALRTELVRLLRCVDLVDVVLDRGGRHRGAEHVDVRAEVRRVAGGRPAGQGPGLVGVAGAGPDLGLEVALRRRSRCRRGTCRMRGSAVRRWTGAPTPEPRCRCRCKGRRWSCPSVVCRRAALTSRHLPRTWRVLPAATVHCCALVPLQVYTWIGLKFAVLADRSSRHIPSDPVIDPVATAVAAVAAVAVVAACAW